MKERTLCIYRKTAKEKSLREVDVTKLGEKRRRSSANQCADYAALGTLQRYVAVPHGHCLRQQNRFAIFNSPINEFYRQNVRAHKRSGCNE
jgi:hypothetical protein